MSEQPPRRLVHEEPSALGAFLRDAAADAPSPEEARRIRDAVLRTGAPVRTRSRMKRRAMAMVLAATMGTALAYGVLQQKHRADHSSAVMRVEPPRHMSAAPVATQIPTFRAQSLAPVPSQDTGPESPRAVAIDAHAELALLDQAAAALRSDPHKALAFCTEHQTRFANGRLTEEREALAIEALAKLGRTTEARARFLQLERRYPHSAHLPRLKSIVE